ncbi:MAG: pilin [Candidatus Falkowbacteria bacterium]
MLKKILAGTILVFVLSFGFFISNNVYAQTSDVGGGIQQSGNSASAAASTATISLQNPLCPANDQNCASGTPQGLIGRVINGVLGIVGSIALLMFIYGGFLWMTSQGNDKQVQTGKDILLWAALGMALIFLSYALVRFLISDVIQAA